LEQPAPERGENRTKTVLEPWPEAQARADEIVAAWDKYLADMRTAREQSGFEKADEAAREAVAELRELEGQIVRTWAKTPMGMLVKARMAAVDPATVSTVDDLEHALEE
jgi:predicted secreted Zn-dependent protease